MNLDGTENKKLAETDELRYATFYFVYNNEAYYYTMYYNENKKAQKVWLHDIKCVTLPFIRPFFSHCERSV